MRCAVLLVLLGLAAARPLFAAAPDSHAAIERCAREADASLRGLEALSRSCPGIEAAVHGLGLDALLPEDWRKTASARALASLAALAERYAAPVPQAGLDGARLKVIARALEPPPAPPSMWERLKRWIRDWLEPKTEGASSWLRFMPNWHISSRLARLIFEALAALIILGVAALVVYELKASGLIGARRHRRSPRGASPGATPTGEGSLDLDALDFAVPRERPALLLRVLVRALTRSRRLRHDRDLTCRELISQARFDTPRQREQFEEVALLAERALYGDPALAPEAVPDDVLTAARVLHAELLAAPRLEPVGP